MRNRDAQSALEMTEDEAALPVLVTVQSIDLAEGRSKRLKSAWSFVRDANRPPAVSAFAD